MIQNPNSSKQGHDPDYINNPFDDLLVQNGFVYSHSTPVIHPGEIRVIHHTYARQQKKISTWYIKDQWHWSGSKSSASSVHTVGISRDRLKQYLKNTRKR